MKLLQLTLATLGLAVALRAQGPPPGGPGGPGGPGFGFGPLNGPPGRAITGAPFAGIQVTQIQQTLVDGNQITRSDQAKFYRDSSGRTRTERTFTPASGQSVTIIAIFDPVAQFVAELNPQNQTAVQHPLPPAPSGTPPAPSSGANAPSVQIEDLGTKTINGLTATGKRETLTFAAGSFGNAQAFQVVRETWTSTDLSVPILVSISDPRRGTTSMQLTNIVQGEQDKSLFVIPSNYTVTTQQFGPPR